MRKDRENVKEANPESKTLLYVTLKVLEELYRDASNARFMLSQVKLIKHVDGLKQTHRFAQKTLLTQYVISLCKLLESVPKVKEEEKQLYNPKTNFSIPSLLKLVYERHKEIQEEIPERFRNSSFSYQTINQHKKQCRDLQTAINALFNFRNKSMAHSDVHYALNPNLQQQDVEKWVVQADELLELCGNILSFYFQLIHERFLPVPPVSVELLNHSNLFESR